MDKEREDRKDKLTPRWGRKDGSIKRRDLTEDQLKKAGYPGAMREEKGWFRGAKVAPR
jgi:hypothetical protein